MNHRVRAACTGRRGLLDHDPAVERALQLLGDELVTGHCALMQDPGSTGKCEPPAGRRTQEDGLSCRIAFAANGCPLALDAGLPERRDYVIGR
jgi:hypothetical protein